MADKTKENDFVEVEYTGKLMDGTVFDTTSERTAKENAIYSDKANYSAAIVCIGEKQLLPGLDDELAGKEIGKEYKIKLPAEKAFGKRDVKNIKIIPMSTFKEHKMNPQPGLQINVDGEMGVVSSVAGGRVIVNFNHPLAGREVEYEFKIIRKITDKKEQLSSFLNSTLRIKKEQIKVELTENGEKAEIVIPAQFPAPLADALGKKMAEITGLKEVNFKNEQPVKKEEKTA
jgi:FKBP-type peptidyl-prolyl cis-trans isomerase SlyD